MEDNPTTTSSDTPTAILEPPAVKPELSDELKALIASAREETRKEVKSQLYPTIEEQKKKLEESKGREKSLADRIKALQANAVDDAVAALKPGDKPKDSAALAAGDFEEVLKGAMTPLLETIESLSTEVVALKTENHTKTVEALRQRVIKLAREDAAKNGEDLVESLISGETEDELVASVERSREEWRKIAEAVRAKEISDARGGAPRPIHAPPPSSSREPGKTDILDPTRLPSASEVKAMSAEDILKLGPQVKANVFKILGINPGPPPAQQRVGQPVMRP